MNSWLPSPEFFSGLVYLRLSILQRTYSSFLISLIFLSKISETVSSLVSVKSASRNTVNRMEQKKLESFVKLVSKNYIWGSEIRIQTVLDMLVRLRIKYTRIRSHRYVFKRNCVSGWFLTNLWVSPDQNKFQGVGLKKASIAASSVPILALKTYLVSSWSLHFNFILPNWLKVDKAKESFYFFFWLWTLN